MPSSDAEKYLKDRFGVELGGEIHYKGDYWYCRQPEEEYETNGIRAVRDMDIGLKPTTYFLQLVEDEISKNKVELSEEEFKVLLNQEMIEREMSKKGYVALFFEGRCFGCGFYMDNLISTRIPEGRAEELLKTL